MPPRKRTTVTDTPSDNLQTHDNTTQFHQLAHQHWLKPTKRTAAVKVNNNILKTEIWDVLAQDDFPYTSLLDLENLQLLSAYLWPGYTDDSTNHHVLLIVLVANVRTRQHLPLWSIFESHSTEFSSLFRRILSMTLDQSLSLEIRTHLLSFIISAFQSLDSGLVRKECAPLVSIAIWHNLSSDKKRDKKLDEPVQLRKAWRASQKRYDAADDSIKARLRFDRQWLYTLILDFFSHIYSTSSKPQSLLYAERFMEFLCDLQSQPPTRRYVNTLLRDLNFLSVIKLSPMFNKHENELLRDLYALLKHYTYFSIDDQSLAQYTAEQAYDQHCQRLSNLQRIALRSFKEKLTVLALSNYGSIEKRSELQGYLQQLTDNEITELCQLLDFRTTYPDSTGVSCDRSFKLEVILAELEKRKTFQETARDLAILPTELTLFDPMLLRNEAYDGSRPLALPKLNLQYLTIGDFLWRSFILHRCESFFEIRKEVENTVKRLKPKLGRNGQTVFDGFSKMALLISKPSVLESVPALVGEDKPSIVKAEIALDVNGLADHIRQDWDSLRPDDVVFLLSIQAVEKTNGDSNGHTAHSEAASLGIKCIRAAEVIQVLDDKGRQSRDGFGQRPRLRRLQVRLDAASYKADMERVESGKANVYDGINVILRRRGRENNFKPILESIQSLTLSDVPLAPWLHAVFLGYGDPAGASYVNLPNQIKKIDYRDTFLDLEHLKTALAGKNVMPLDDQLLPPYVLETTATEDVPVLVKGNKKRRRERPESNDDSAATPLIHVTTYRPQNHGPYPTDDPKLNKIRFTPAQIEAITSGTQPGLTVIVGPPGTGKTDVATQIINNIYHNFPEQRTLLIAHSNQALNQLFQKIVALDIDERHLLRLGHGESELDTDTNFSKFGRVESFLENRDRYLHEVNRLAANLRAPGAHGSSAETAGYFNSVYVQPAWTRFQEVVKMKESSPEDVLEAFPFHEYFSNAPQPVFPADASRETILDIADGCYRHISRVFSELADVRPFEILPRERDKANYLLTNEARIIAMTSTHAAMRRRQIADLGFHYDNVVMEEAAQITEVENFIPLALQNLKSGARGLQRVVLCGDHLQNSPVVQNLAFRQYANLEQSLFSRMVRLGVPHINLDQQGRARASIAELYQWRYTKLDNLPVVQMSPEFATANAGFKYEYQFIDVPDYKGRGESEPSPHFIQNLGEAEYAVAIYQYMRLLGYPAEKISILTTYAGQRALIKDVLAHRCVKNPLFGSPKIVTTVDKYQGEQNDYVILSLTRTSRVGYLRDVRRLTVALSRARLGLYILGRRDVFSTCHELAPAFDILLQRPDKLTLVTGEMFPSSRQIPSEEGKKTKTRKKEIEVQGESIMEGVEHLGQYVFEMTNARVNMLRKERGIGEDVELAITATGETMIGDVYDEDDDVETEEGTNVH